MTKLFQIILSGSLLLAPGARAAGKAPSTSHHCVKDGTEVVGASKKECKKQGGKWEKIAAAPAVPAPPTTPAPSAEKAP